MRPLSAVEARDAILAAAMTAALFRATYAATAHARFMSMYRAALTALDPDFEAIPV